MSAHLFLLLLAAFAFHSSSPVPHRPSYEPLYRKINATLDAPREAQLKKFLRLRNLLKNVFGGGKTAEFYFWEETGMSMMAAGSAYQGTQMVFNEKVDVKLPIQLAYPGAVVFVNQTLRKGIHSIGGFKILGFILYGACETVFRQFRKLWNDRIYNVLGVCFDSTAVRLLVTEPFNGNECDMRIKEVPTRKLRSSTVSRKLIKKLTAPLDLHGCWVYASFFDSPPAFIRGYIREGFEVDVLREVFKRANGKVRLRMLKKKSDGSFVLSKELNKNVDVVGGMIYNPFLKSEELGVLCGLTVDMTWVTPRWRKFQLVDLTVAFLTLPADLMLALLFAYLLVTSFFLLASLKDGKTNWRSRTNFFNIIFLIANQPSQCPPLRTSSARLQFAVWSYFALIISCSYQAGLKSHMTVGETDILISSMRDILNSDLKILCKISYYYSHLKNLLNMKPEYGVLNDRIIYLKDESDTIKVLKQMAIHGDAALLEKVELLEYAFSFIGPRARALLKIHYGFSERVITPFVLKKKSFFGDHLIRACSSFSEAGIVGFIKNTYDWKVKLRTKRKRRPKTQALTLTNTSHGFFLLLFGLYVSFSVFLLELFYCWLIRKMKMRKWAAAIVAFVWLVAFVSLPMSFDVNGKTPFPCHENFTLDMTNHTVSNDTWWGVFT